MTTCEQDQHWMHRALDLARKGLGHVEPNPLVGCVLVKNQELVASGWHQQFGGPHAEIHALQEAGSRAAGCTLYVTLEPCSHQGKTPPCTTAIQQAGIQRVVIGQQDPFAEVNGRGIQQLEEAGLEIERGVLETECRHLNGPYLKRLATGKPWVVAKWAMSRDGKLAASDGSSRWISSPTSRELVHQIRGRMDAILVGRETALLDNPQLTARPPGARVPTRIVMTTLADLPNHLTLLQTARETPTLITCGPDAPTKNRKALEAAGCEVFVTESTDRCQMINELLCHLGRQQMTNLLIEGGSQLLVSCFNAKAIDEVHIFVANKHMGGTGAANPLELSKEDSMDSERFLEQLQSRTVESDLYYWGQLDSSTGLPIDPS